MAAAAAADNDPCLFLYSCIVLSYTIFCTTNLANLEPAGTHYFWKYSTTLYGTVLLPPSGCTLHHINKVDIRYFKFAHAGRWLILFKHHFTLLKRFVFLYMWLLKFGHYISHLSINTKASCITYILFAYVTFYMPLIRLSPITTNRPNANSFKFVFIAHIWVSCGN